MINQIWIFSMKGRISAKQAFAVDTAQDFASRYDSIGNKLKI